MAPENPNDSGNEGTGSPPDENEASASKVPPEAGQDELSPEADSDVPSADPGGVGQDEIDALIRGLEDSDSTPASPSAPSPAGTPSETTSADSDGVGQDEIDALIRGLGDSESTPASPPAPSPTKDTSATSSPTAGDVDQDEIDAVAEGPDDSGPSSAPDEASASATPTLEEVLVDDSAKEEPELLDQDALDALIADFESHDTSADVQEPATKKPVEVSLEAQAPESTSELSPDTEAEEAPAVLDRQSDMDLLVAEASQGAEEKISADVPEEAQDPEIEAALLELEQHAAEGASVSEEEIASPASLAPEESESPEADAEPAAVDSESLSLRDDDIPIIDQLADESLVDDDMDARLDSADAPRAEAVPEADSEEPAVETERIVSRAFVSDIEADATDAADESTNPAAMLERVASENVAAGAVENAQEPDASSAAPEVEAAAQEDLLPPEEAPAPGEGEDVEPVKIGRAFSRDSGGDGARPSGFEQIRRSPARVVASLAAGLLFSLGVFVYFYANQLRSVSDLALFPIGDTSDLNRVVMHARELLDEGKSSEAVKLLDAALTRAPRGASGIDDARYLRLEGVYQALPETIGSSVADDMHVQIDYLVETARSHPRAPEALYWKAKVYEREDNPIAARAEYRGILDNFGNAANLDQVLLSLSELLLAADHPIQAVPYLQRVIQQFPGTPPAALARLYLGDANAAAGNSDDALTVYIRLAESQANTSIGALAYERIGKLAIASGDYSGAIRELEGRLEEATTVEGNDHLYILLGTAYRSIGRLEDARDILTELIDFFPESETTPGALVELSQVMSAMELDREAVRMALQAVERYPENVLVLRNAGELLGASGNAIAAARALVAAHSAGADDPELLLAAGRHFKNAGIDDDAVAAFQELLELFPTSSQALEGNIEWARVLYEQGHITRALGRLEGLMLATEGQPRRIPVLRALGKMYEDLGLRQEVADVHAQIAGLAQEPELLAQAAIGLVRAGEADAGMRVVERVDRTRLTEETAYALMMAQAEVWLRRDATEALEIMEEAHASYPDHRTPEGVQRLLEASLTTGQTARARALVSDLRVRAAQTERAEEWEWLERAAIAWGDYLYGRKDYRTALEAYTIALEPLERETSSAAVESAGAPLSPPQLWSMYQRSNALFSLARFQESIEDYDIVAASSSVWAEEAKTKAQSARIEIRLRGDPVGETRKAG